MINTPDSLTTVATRQSVNIYLVFAVAMLSAGAFLAICGLLYVALWHPTYFVASGTHGPVRANEPSDAFLFEFAERCVHDRYTWSYLDIERAQKKFLACLHPAIRTDYERKVLKDEQKQAREWEATSGIVHLQTWEVERDGLNRHLKVRVIRHRWYKGTPDADDMTVDMILVPLLEGGWPIDVAVWGWADDKPLKLTGQKK
jgi:hypothetical protein